MNPLHLIWIIPLSSTMGVLTMCLAAANETSRDNDRIVDLTVALRDLIQVHSNPRSNGESWSDWQVRRRAAFGRAEKVLGL